MRCRCGDQERHAVSHVRIDRGKNNKSIWLLRLLELVVIQAVFPSDQN